MKKILSLVLAVIMLLSVMPVVYAQRATYSPEIEEYIENFIRALSYCNSEYESDEQQAEVHSIFLEYLEENFEMAPDYEILVNIEPDGCLDEIIALNEGFDKAFDEMDKKIAADEIVIVVDTYEYYKYLWHIEGCYYSDKDQYELMDRAEAFGSDKFIAVRAEFENGKEHMYKACTQADFDDAMAKIKPYADSLIACLDGDHPYGEYVSNNDATEETDGTKTATCEFCGATNTITDEGTKLVKEEEPKEEKVSFFEMLIALIKDFFELIFSIFA